ncbi:MAG: hypothetical protein AAGB14_02990, partial [Verrucomicrobiota bacterium]
NSSSGRPCRRVGLEEKAPIDQSADESTGSSVASPELTSSAQTATSYRESRIPSLPGKQKIDTLYSAPEKMKTLQLLFALLMVPILACAEGHPDDVFYTDLKRIEAKYRISKARLIKKADRVIIYLVDFDGIKDAEIEVFGDDEDEISVAPYGGETRVLKSKEVVGEERKTLLAALGDQIAKPDHSGGAFCHYPIHGIRVYSGEEVLHEGTFCWVCSNFSFSYPQGASWLDTTPRLKEVFTSLLPIPQKELDRFHKKYPGAEPKESEHEE